MGGRARGGGAARGGLRVHPVFYGIDGPGFERPGSGAFAGARKTAQREKAGKESARAKISIQRCGWICWLRAKKHSTREVGRNIFVSQAEAVVIPHPITPGTSPDVQTVDQWHPPTVPQAPPIPLKFYGFASRTGEPKKIFLKLGEDVFVAGEGEIVDRRYKVIRISPNSVEIQDVLNSGPPQNIPLTQG